MDFCVRIFERENRMYFLKNCELSSISVPNLPSWVPDWSTSMTAEGFQDNNWSACGFISASATYLGNKTLRVSGVQIDEITSTRDIYYHANDGPCKGRSVLIEHIWECCPGQDRIYSPYDQQQSNVDAYCRTFARGCFFETRYPAHCQTAGNKMLSFDEVRGSRENLDLRQRVEFIE